MTDHLDADVAIIGYGPTGVLAALTLARRGVSVVAFERERSIYARARAVTVNDWTMRIFQDLGIDERVEKKLDPQRANRWVRYDGTEVFRVEHPPSTLGRGSKFYNIYQPTMEAELRACADELGDLVDVRYGAEVVGVDQDTQGVSVTTTDPETGRTSTTRARYAIAADGGSSATRRHLGIALEGDTRDVTWVVIDCRVKRWWPNRNLLTYWSDQERPVVDIALSAGNHRWEIPLRPGETPADFPTSAEVWPLLKALGITEDDVEIHQHAFYQHHNRMAERWRDGRVFLAGDAAHLMPPWAGAGMQSGMRDAHNLGWKLAGVLDGTLPEAWLDTYETERRANVQYYTNLSERLGRIIRQELTPEDQAELEARSAASRRGEGHDPLDAGAPRLSAGWLRGPVGDGSVVGRMVPQPVVGDTVGRIGRLDDLIGHGFVLIGDDVDPATLLAPDEKAAWDALGARYLTIRPPDGYTHGPEEIVDLDQVLGPWLRKYGARAVALRPDRFVAAADLTGLGSPELP